MALGKLLVDIAANVAGFQSDMGKILHLAEKTSANISKSFSNAGKTIAASLTIGAIGSFLQHTIDIGDELNDLSQITDITHESLARYALIARQSGLDTDSLATNLQKLGKNIGDAASGNEDLVKTFTALGVTQKQIKDGNLDDILQSIAKRFNEFEKGNAAGKIDLLADALGKTGAKTIPFLKAVAEADDSTKRLAATFSEEFASAADQFNDNTEAMKTGVSSVGAVFLTELLPLVNQVIKSFDGYSTAATLAFGASKIVATGVLLISNTVKIATTLFTSLGTAIAAIAAAITQLAEGDFSGALDTIEAGITDIQTNLQSGADDITKYVDTWLNGTAKIQADSNTAKIKVPTINKDDNAKLKASLEQRLKLLDGAIAKEQSLLQSRNDALQGYYDQDYLSISEYYSKRRQVLERATDSQLRAYDKQISALQAFMKQAGKESERISTLTKINDILDKKNKLETDAAANGTKMWFEEQNAIKQYKDKITELGASLDEITRNTAQAATTRFDQSNEQFRKRLESEGDKASLLKLDRLRTLTVAQAQYSQYSEEADLVNSKLTNSEERLSQARSKGSIDELQYMAQLSEARMNSVQELQAIYEKQLAIAEASGDPKMLEQAEAFRLKLEELKDNSDVLYSSLKQISENAFGTFFQDILSGTESAGSAFKKLAATVIGEIAKMAAQAAAAQLIKGLFGGGASGAGGGGAGGWAGFLAGLFMAEGGPIIPGRPYVVGEQGPEVIVPSSHGTVVPNRDLGASGGMNVVNNFTINGNMDRRSQQQIAAEVGQSVNRAVKRNK